MGLESQSPPLRCPDPTRAGTTAFGGPRTDLLLLGGILAAAGLRPRARRRARAGVRTPLRARLGSCHGTPELGAILHRLAPRCLGCQRADAVADAGVVRSVHCAP